MTADQYRTPAVGPPSLEDLQAISEELGLGVAVGDLPQYRDKICELLKAYDVVDSLPDTPLPVKYPRTPGYQPHPSHNPYNAWAWRCDVKGASTGKLAGLRVALKDNVSVAGVPLNHGSALMRGYIPDGDATVVSRILDQGGTIVGMTSCENFCYTNYSFTSPRGPVLNPHDPTRTTGGSSSGSAVVVATGEADVALGGDQGGSIRTPSSWCGIVGLKPTFGLVPYTGICPLEPSVDHVGPMARTVYNCALLLEVIAGYDNGRDQRQRCDVTVPEYTKLLTGDVSGTKVAILQEGFHGVDPAVDDIVKSAVNRLSTVGVTVSTISFPLHLAVYDVSEASFVDGFYNTILKNQGLGIGHKGYYQTSLVDKMATTLLAEPHLFSEAAKCGILTARLLDEKHHGRYYGKAQNVIRDVTRQYEELFTKYDAIVMPTLPVTAPKLPTADSTLKDRMRLTSSPDSRNLSGYNATGHPALTVPVGWVEGLPVGMMFVGGYYREVKLLNLARAWEIIRDSDGGDKQ